ncbi:iron-containing redox enzyme family protein [Myxococcus sp. AB025B]|uniref:iron-containing redox enzyme family protein n=1 Tax=Myxococcus sp. AB025B TaxID=2562794 RepID=UPI0011425C30|nr:iron-containing redox enzyme family protein [Myxococcus sp. AB025B]
MSLASPSATPQLRRYIAAFKERGNHIKSSKYLNALTSGDFSREDFVEAQVHMRTAVANFSRPMALLLSRLPNVSDRLPLLENVIDEHGNGKPGEAHDSAFCLLLERLGAPRGRVEKCRPWPEILAFNTSLAGTACFESVHFAMAVFGMIEDLFGTVALITGESIVKHGWLARDQMVHYPLHATLDNKHADDFYRFLDDAYEADPKLARDIEQGLALGAHLIMNLFDDLYRARHRRSN